MDYRVIISVINSNIYSITQNLLLIMIQVSSHSSKITIKNIGIYRHTVYRNITIALAFTINCISNSLEVHLEILFKQRSRPLQIISFIFSKNVLLINTSATTQFTTLIQHSVKVRCKKTVSGGGI